MLNRVFGLKTHSYLHVLGLSGIAGGLPWSKVMMSISMMFLVLNLLLEADFRTYWQNIKQNRLFQLIFAFFVFHLVSFLWSDNIGYALHDLKAKLPLLIIPLALVCKPIADRKSLHIILSVLVGTVFITSFINFSLYQQWFGSIIYDDIRGMSRFSSHIRYALLIVMSISICVYFAKENRRFTIPLALLATWFIYYTIYSQVIAGVVSLIAILFIAVFYALWFKYKLFAFTFAITSLVGAGISLFWLFTPLKPSNYKLSDLPKYTAQGNPYSHHIGFISSETGEPILLNLSEKELEEEWNKRSKIPYDGRDIKGNRLKHTLIRYLSSKRLLRDASGVKALNQQDIKNIEKGFPSVNHNGLMARLHGIRFELNNSTNANGHSLLQRLEFWKTGMSIAKNNALLGVGVGDVQDQFDLSYKVHDSILLPENRKRAHNMYLTVWITFGIAGAILFLSMLFNFLMINFKRREILALLFMVISMSSFLTEDTLETQTGVTFFALFYAIFQTKLPSKKSSEASIIE